MSINAKKIEKSDLEFDKAHMWHPYTSLTNPLKVYPVTAANGVRIQLNNGEKLIDGMASWWSVIHGYNHPELNRAAKNQIDQMSHVMFGGITHQPAIDLCKKLIDITPSGLDRVFLCDSGSISVEVAMKVAIQYQHAKKAPERNKFMTFRNGYHGDTTAAMSVCDPITGMHHLFQNFMPEHHFIPAPQKKFDEACTVSDERQIEEEFERYAKDSAAFILEPILQGTGGMRAYSPDYLKLVRRLCSQYDMLLIADEIATGFGRTGKLFAVEHASIVPDILTVGKALTGGYMTLAAMICTQHVSNTICNGEAGVLMHGPTFMGNPLACAVANKSLELLLESDWKANIHRLESEMQKHLSPALQKEKVKDVRIIGGVGVIETHKNINVQKAQELFVKMGVWIRPFMNLIYIMPPYVMKNEDLKRVCSAMVESVDHESIFQ